jgi:hypothetical protein
MQLEGARAAKASATTEMRFLMGSGELLRLILAIGLRGARIFSRRRGIGEKARRAFSSCDICNLLPLLNHNATSDGIGWGQGPVCGRGGHPESVLAAQPCAQNLVARDDDQWWDVTASFAEILVPIAEFLRRPTLR